MTDYYRILGLKSDASVFEIKQAYRQKARLYHPDISKDQNTQDLFISATEAYDFLISCQNKLLTDNETDSQVFANWQKQSQKRARRKAYTYAKGSYYSFKKSNLYKTTRFFNGTITVCGLTISLVIIIYTIVGYFYRLKHPIPEMEKPSLFVFIMLLLIGIVFFLVSLAFLIKDIKYSTKKKK